MAACLVERSAVAVISRVIGATEAPSSEQVVKELERLVDVLSVRDVNRNPQAATTAVVPTHTQADGDGPGDDEEAA